MAKYRLLFLTAVFLVSTCGIQDDRQHLRHIHPGMTPQQVIEALPQRIVRLPKKQTDDLVSGIYLVNSNTLVASELGITTDSPLGLGEIYIDKNDKVVGIDYSASSAHWEPTWGVPVTVWMTNRYKNIYRPPSEAEGTR